MDHLFGFGGTGSLFGSPTSQSGPFSDLYGSSVDGGTSTGMELAPLYSSSGGHAGSRDSIRDIIRRQPGHTGSRYGATDEDYEENEETFEHYGADGAHIGARVSRTHQTPFGPINCGADMQMRIGRDGVSVRTTSTSSFGGRRMLTMSMSSIGHYGHSYGGLGGGLFRPMIGMFSPFGGLLSPFGGMLSQGIDSGNDEYPYQDHTQAFGASEFDDCRERNSYTGPIIEEIDEDHASCRTSDKREGRRKVNKNEIDPSLGLGLLPNTEESEDEETMEESRTGPWNPAVKVRNSRTLGDVGTPLVLQENTKLYQQQTLQGENEDIQLDDHNREEYRQCENDLPDAHNPAEETKEVSAMLNADSLTAKLDDNPDDSFSGDMFAYVLSPEETVAAKKGAASPIKDSEILLTTNVDADSGGSDIHYLTFDTELLAGPEHKAIDSEGCETISESTDSLVTTSVSETVVRKNDLKRFTQAADIEVLDMTINKQTNPAVSESSPEEEMCREEEKTSANNEIKSTHTDCRQLDMEKAEQSKFVNRKLNTRKRYTKQRFSDVEFGFGQTSIPLQLEQQVKEGEINVMKQSQSYKFTDTILITDEVRKHDVSTTEKTRTNTTDTLQFSFEFSSNDIFNATANPHNNLGAYSSPSDDEMFHYIQDDNNQTLCTAVSDENSCKTGGVLQGKLCCGEEMKVIGNDDDSVEKLISEDELFMADTNRLEQSDKHSKEHVSVVSPQTPEQHMGEEETLEAEKVEGNYESIRMEKRTGTGGRSENSFLEGQGTTDRSNGNPTSASNQLGVNRSLLVQSVERHGTTDENGNTVESLNLTSSDRLQKQEFPKSKATRETPPKWSGKVVDRNSDVSPIESVDKKTGEMCLHVVFTIGGNTAKPSTLIKPKDERRTEAAENFQVCHFLNKEAENFTKSGKNKRQTLRSNSWEEELKSVKESFGRTSSYDGHRSVEETQQEEMESIEKKDKEYVFSKVHKHRASDKTNTFALTPGRYYQKSALDESATRQSSLHDAGSFNSTMKSTKQENGDLDVDLNWQYPGQHSYFQSAKHKTPRQKTTTAGHIAQSRTHHGHIECQCQLHCKHKKTHVHYDTCCNTSVNVCNDCGLKFVGESGKVHGVQGDTDDTFDHPEWQHLNEYRTFSGETPAQKKKVVNKNAKVMSASSASGDSSGTSPASSEESVTSSSQYTSGQTTAKTSQYTKSSHELSGLVESVGLTAKDVYPDGNCLFTAVVDQLRIRGDFSYTSRDLRQAAVDYLQSHPKQEDGTPLSSFLTDYESNWEDYLKNMRHDGHWGDHIVIMALANVLNQKIIIYRGGTELHQTVLEPTGRQNKADEDDGESKNNVDDQEHNEMHLGHISESHYVSLRPKDWKENLMNILKKKSTPAIIGINAESKTLDSTFLLADITHQHFDFAMKFILFSDLVFIPTESRNNEAKDSSPRAKCNSTYELYHWLDDCMIAYNFGASLTGESMSGKLSAEREMSNAEAIVLQIPLDTKVLNQRSRYMTNKDLIAYSDNCPVGLTELRAVEPVLWVNSLVNGDFLPHLMTKWPHLPLENKIREENIKLAFKCEWPLAAMEWKTRQRKYSWPSQEVINRITEDAGRVIPAEKGSSSSPETHWQYAFDNAEKMLAEEALSSEQLQCFRLTKVLVDDMLSDEKLTLKQLKNVFFYLCEETDSLLWIKESAVCLQRFLDRLCVCVSETFIPSYFMPAVNLLHDTDEERLNVVQTKLKILRKNPFVIMYFTFEHYIQLYNTINMLFDRLIEDTRRYIRNQRLEVSLNACFLPLVAEGIYSVLVKGQYSMALEKCKQAALYFESISVISQGSLESVLMTVIYHSTSKLHQWVFAFYVDQVMNTWLLEIVCKDHPTASLFDYFGAPLAKHLHMSLTDILIPVELVSIDKLVKTFVEVFEVLKYCLSVPGDALKEALSYFMQTHFPTVMKFAQANPDPIMLNCIKIIQNLMKIESLGSQIRGIKRKFPLKSSLNKWY